MPSDPAAPVRSASPDDLALVRAMADRRPEAMAELYDRYAPTLLGVARSILGAGPAAAEALHEGLLEAWAHAERYLPARTSVATWLVLIVRARALARRRAAGPAPVAGAAAAAAASPRSEPPERARRRQRVRTALAALPADQREVLELAFWEGLASSEIARRTETNADGVRRRALEAMRALRRTLRDELRERM